jgi:alcohol dehydrogenase (cytochrome c)
MPRVFAIRMKGLQPMVSRRLALGRSTLIALLAAASGPVDSAGTAGKPAPDLSRQEYLRNCSSCHGPAFGGGPFGPTLKGEAFHTKWATQGESALRDFISRNMPPADPGGLTPDTYRNISSYILAANHAESDKVVAHTGATASTDRVSGKAALETGGGTAPVEARDAQYQAAIANRVALLDAIRPVSDGDLRNPSPADWLNWRRTDDAFAHSPLNQINTDNIQALSLAWSIALPHGTNEITPIVRDGVMFLDSNGTVAALDASTGDILWTFARTATTVPMGIPLSQPRGMAILGIKLFVPTSDSHMIALDARTGKTLWDHFITGGHGGVRITASPMVVHGRVIQGLSGCWGTVEPGGCFIVALDADTGREDWRFHTIPNSTEPGGNSWNGLPQSQRFGASVWSTPTYDAATNLIYFGASQTYHIASLMLPAGKRSEVNAGMYTDSTLALNPDTGKLAWYFQHMARDVWDLDWAYERTIATLDVDSSPRKVVMTLGKIGMLDGLDAKTGQYLFSYDLGMQNLITAVDPVTGWKTTDPKRDPDPVKSVPLCPFAVGIRSWPGTSFDPQTHTLFTGFGDSCMEIRWNRGEDFDITYGSRPRPGSDGSDAGIAAINLNTRKPVWQYKTRAPAASAVLTTDGGLVFIGYNDRSFMALDNLTGNLLWKVRLDDTPSASPITFEANHTQYIAVTTGGGNPNEISREPMTPEYKPLARATTLWVFKLGPTNPAPAVHTTRR